MNGRRQKLELHERCLAAARLADLPCLTASDPRAHVALTALGSNQLQLYTGIKLKLRYGVTLHRAALHHNRAMTHGFDGMLVHGAFERDLFSRWLAPERIKLVGMPRHAAYLAQPLAKLEARAQLGILPDKTVIAYLPTWSVQSSLHSFVEPLGALARVHSLLVRPHALSLASREERAALAALEQRGAHIMQDRAALKPRVHAVPAQPWLRAPDRRAPLDPRRARVVQSDAGFSQLVAAADLVLADATSGAATEAALLAPDTPLVLLSLRAPTALFREIEQLGALVRDPAALPGAVAHHLQHDDQRGLRAALCARLFFTERAGARAPELAADAISELARLPKISKSPGFFDRFWPRAARVARGRAIALQVKWAPVPPRDLASRATLPTAASDS